MMKSLLILVAFLAIFINNSNCSKSSKKCKESSFRPCESFDIKKFAGKWYTYARYENGMGKKNTCAFCEIIYNKCKDKYRIKHNSFINDVAEPIQQAWIDTPTENGIVNFLWDNKDSIARIYITEVDYEKYALVRGCYGKKQYVLILVRSNRPDKKLNKKIKKLIKDHKLNNDELYKLEFGC